jgi:hypothetical protein
MSLEAAPSGAQAVAAALRQPDPFRFNGRCLLKAVSEVLRPFFRWRRGCARRYGATASS